MAVMGGNAIHLDMQGVSIIADATQENISCALFALLSQFPLPNILSLMAIILVFVFFVTSADSSTYVCATLTAKGVQNPPSSLKIFWGVIESSVAAVLLYVGGLSALRSAAIIAALPLMFVCLLMAAALMKTLKHDIS
jgi:choline-glycine betaine transporter